MLADALAVVRQGEYEKAKLHLLALGMTPAQIKVAKRRTWRRLCMTHQPEPTVLLQRMWDVVMCSQTMMDPERPGHHFFVENWLDIPSRSSSMYRKAYYPIP